MNISVRRWGILIVAVLGCASLQCKNNSTTTEAGNWYKASELDGVVRSGAVAFVVNGKAYMGTGYNGSQTQWLNDFWEYDTITSSWTQEANFPGTPRNGAIGMGIGNEGYIGTGYDGTNYLNDFWQYDPPSNIWSPKSNFPGNPREGASSFAIQNLGYITMGFNGAYLKDFWSYEPSSDTWKELTSSPGAKRENGLAFVINDTAYICTGVNNGTYVDDMWKYDPSTGLWSQKRNISNIIQIGYNNTYTNIIRSDAVAMVLYGKAYITTGVNGTLLTATWQYDPVTDTWITMTAFTGTAREDAIAFNIGNRGFLGMGQSNNLWYDDLWEFRPNEVYNVNASF
jgi:N-acetylneuraminic acid mutarotase